MGLAQSASALPPPGSFSAPLTATAGGGQANALLLTKDHNIVGTVATAGDSVKVGPAVPGASVIVLNTAANSLNVFPSSGDAIGAGAADAAAAVTQNLGLLLVCVVAGRWLKFLSV